MKIKLAKKAIYMYWESWKLYINVLSKSNKIILNNSNKFEKRDNICKLFILY